MPSDQQSNGAEVWVRFKLDNKDMSRDIKRVGQRMKKEFGEAGGAAAGREAVGAKKKGASALDYMFRTAAIAGVIGGAANMVANPYQSASEKAAGIPLLGGLTHLLQGGGGFSMFEQSQISGGTRGRLSGIAQAMGRGGEVSPEMMTRLVEMVRPVVEREQRAMRALNDAINEKDPLQQAIEDAWNSVIKPSMTGIIGTMFGLGGNQSENLSSSMVGRGINRMTSGD